MSGTDLRAELYRLCREDRRVQALAISRQNERIADLEEENRALREFVAARDVTRAMEVQRDDDLRWKRMQDADAHEEQLRQRLATEHGLPLPEVER